MEAIRFKKSISICHGSAPEKHEDHWFSEAHFRPEGVVRRKISISPKIGVVVPGLYRSRSLPHYLGCDSGVGSFSEGGGGGVGGPDDKGGGAGGGLGPSDKGEGLAGELRQLITLRQHYYPEGGWGWVVLAAALATHLLSHGLQLGSVVLPAYVHHKFGPRHPTVTGTQTFYGQIVEINAYLFFKQVAAVARKQLLPYRGSLIGGELKGLAIIGSDSRADVDEDEAPRGLPSDNSYIPYLALATSRRWTSPPRTPRPFCRPKST
ncbi:unnamed protein product [Nesidiocoris tenuis]|uniref:Uncharacterized protein n=1 Tax=Nesidiocoris tenuis TaxID=355587 RepID=A0A6H5GSE1_9HEMI|nr:unnamed protein product [Nesidiocoris tenuis]